MIVLTDTKLLLQMLGERFITVQKHPEADLFIYNYSNKAQYERVWNEITLQCRGLILDAEFNIIARPFKKFFNLEEHPVNEIPDEPFELFEKMDGSLGILYWLNNLPYIATRGSFISQQALHATKILNDNYQHTFDKLNKNATYLFEIIYPGNKIVIDYADKDDLILLAVIDNKTGLDLPLIDIGFPRVKKHDGINDIKLLNTLQPENKEGFVIKFKSGLRVKIKFAEYLRLHKIITGVSKLVIWEHLSEGMDLDNLLEKVPDEFYEWVKKTINNLTEQYNAILNDSKVSFNKLDADLYGNRKEIAMYFKTQKYQSVLFAMLDGKPYDKIIWKMIRSHYAKPYKTEI